jgi:hypothetical protein
MRTLSGCAGCRACQLAYANTISTSMEVMMVIAQSKFVPLPVNGKRNMRMRVFGAALKAAAYWQIHPAISMRAGFGLPTVGTTFALSNELRRPEIVDRAIRDDEPNDAVFIIGCGMHYLFSLSLPANAQGHRPPRSRARECPRKKRIASGSGQLDGRTISRFPGQPAQR